MQIVARAGWDEIEWGTPLLRAWIRGALPEEVRPPRLDLAAEHAGATPALAALARSGERALVEPGATAIVTGQQPGCAGGAALVLYKAATAVALARRARAVRGQPVVPVFWNATDDDDFDEIATVAWAASGHGLYSLELPRSERRAGGWVGDLPAAGDEAVVRAALDLVPAAASAALESLLPRGAADHGTWVGTLLGRIFPELWVLDARSPMLRRMGAALFARYLDLQEDAHAAVEDGARRVEAAGFRRTLEPGSARAALFHTGGRRREKTVEPGPLRAALETDAALVSPNVVLRPLLQDSVLPTLAHVVGPAEVGYLVELRALRALLGVPEPALVPRATASAFDAATWKVLESQGVEARTVLVDAEEPLERLVASAAAWPAPLAAAFADLRQALDAAAPSGAARRRLDRLEQETRAELRAEKRAEIRRRHPELAALPDLLRPRGRAQERQMAALWLVAHAGPGAGEALVALADTHLEALAAGRGEHFLLRF